MAAQCVHYEIMRVLTDWLRADGGDGFQEVRVHRGRHEDGGRLGRQQMCAPVPTAFMHRSSQAHESPPSHAGDHTDACVRTHFA